MKKRLKNAGKYVILFMGEYSLILLCVFFHFHRGKQYGRMAFFILSEGRWA